MGKIQESLLIDIFYKRTCLLCLSIRLCHRRQVYLHIENNGTETR